LLESVEQSRAAIDEALTATQVLSNTLTAAAQATPLPVRQHGSQGGQRFPSFAPVLNAWDTALATAQQASGEMYAAQALDLSAEITLLDLESSPERYAAFTNALEARFPGEQFPSYAQANQLGVPPGEIACASWYAFETREQVMSVLQNLKRSGQSCEGAGLARHLMGESMEIAEGLVYQDYTDAPQPVKI
jgi:hypothetical protein